MEASDRGAAKKAALSRTMQAAEPHLRQRREEQDADGDPAAHDDHHLHEQRPHQHARRGAERP